MTKINLKALDRDIFIQGDDSVARTIQIGQTNAVNDVVVIDSATWGVTAAGVGNFDGNVAFSGGLTSPAGSGGSSFRAGLGALAAITSGFGDTALGDGALASLTVGNNCLGVGLNAGDGIVDAADCVILGNNAMRANVSNDNLIAIGSQAMRYFEGANSVAIGSAAMAGSQVTALTAQFCVAIGANVMTSAQGAAWNNIGIGGGSLQGLTTATGNTCIGKDTGNDLTTGGSNVFIGNATGDSTVTGSSNILIGSGLDTTATSTVGELRIHYAGGSNIPILSGDMVTGKLGVNTLALRTATVNIQTDASDGVDCLLLDQDDISENFIQFTSTSAASVTNPLTSYTTGNTIQGFLRIDVNGTARWVAFYDNPTS